jgi:hypothetical protein
MPASITFDNTQRQNAKIATPGKFSGVPSWSVHLGDVTLAVAADGMSAFIISGSVGISDVRVTIQVDESDGLGVQTVTDDINVTVTQVVTPPPPPIPLTSISFAFDPPVPK